MQTTLVIPRAQATPPRLAFLASYLVPTVRFKRLWHVGTLDVTHKGCRGASHEGNGLSISQCPEDWTGIAHLSGDTWEFRKPANRFMAFHKLTPRQRQALQDWGVATGYLELREQWKMSYYDSETEDTCFCYFDTEEEARAEIPDWVEEDEGAAPAITMHMIACPTASMNQRLGFDTATCHALDITATFFVEDETELDGVWWQDTYAPHNLSAPRGVIVKRALSTWDRTRKSS